MAADGTARADEERFAFAAAETGDAASLSLRHSTAADGPGSTEVATAKRRPRLLSGSVRTAPWHAVAPAIAAEWERGGAFLLIPILFGAGAVANFTAAREPSALLLAILAVSSAAAMFVSGHRAAPRFAATAALVFLLGMLAASYETRRAGTKMLGAEISTRVTGRVVLVEERADQRPRITIDVTATERPQLRYAPERIRVTAREIPDDLDAGQAIAGVVRLLPTTGPVRPDSYDFSFESYFEGIGASGFFLAGPFPVEAQAPPSRLERLHAWVENARDTLADHIRSRIGGAEGGIAAALVAGVRSGIPEEDNEALRRTGLYHIISISGLHMALVAGTVLGGLRMGFALFPGFASRYPVKKFAAGAALVALCFYLLISGAEVAAQRSFIMFAVMLVAVMFDRAGLTMRNLAIAALIVLAVAPHEVMGPSFQMSFAATAALIGAYAWYAERRRERATDRTRDEQGPARRVASMLLLFFGGLAMTSLIAGTATGLFAAWHFQRIAPLGLVANLAAMPIVTLAVMPMAVMGTLLIPLGLDAPFFAIMGKGLAAVMAIAKWIAERSPVDEVGLVPPMAVMLLTIALAIMTVATTWLRIAAVPFMLAGGALILAREIPDVLMSEDGRLVAMRMSDARLAVNRARPSAFTIENWARAVQGRGVVKPQDDVPDATTEHAFACSDGLCVARHLSGAIVAFAKTAEDVKPACETAVLIVIDDATAKDVCNGASSTTVVTKRDLALKGSAAVQFSSDGRIASLQYAIGEELRAWHDQRRFSREARGMPPYQRKPAPETKPAGETRPVEDSGEAAAGGGSRISSGG